MAQERKKLKNDTSSGEKGGQLEQVFDRLSGFASRLQRKTRFFLLLGILVACWFAYLPYSLFALSLITTAILGVILILPTVIVYMAHTALSDLSTLPETYQKMKAGISEIQVDLEKSMLEKANNIKKGSFNGRFREIISVGRLILEIKEKVIQQTGAADLLGNAGLLANPLFSILVVVSIIYIGILAPAAVLTFLFVLIF